MRALVATFVLALLLAGCQGTGSGMLGQLTLPPPGTQPPGTLLAGNNYYPAPNSTSAVAATTSPAPSLSAALAEIPLAAEFARSSGTTLQRDGL